MSATARELRRRQRAAWSDPDRSPGELVGFVGANGAGKSTTMRIAMGLLAAGAGEVLWDGQSITAAVRRRFGYLPEQRGLYPKMAAVAAIVAIALVLLLAARIYRSSILHTGDKLSLRRAWRSEAVGS